MKENEKLFGKMSSHLAEYDYLTGLPNRRGLYEFYDILESKDSIHAMFIDIDNFKSVNDVYGHTMGDHVISVIAGVISSQFRSTDYVGRVGGDEFCVLMADIPSREIALIKAENLVNLVKYKELIHTGKYIHQCGNSIFRSRGSLLL